LTNTSRTSLPLSAMKSPVFSMPGSVSLASDAIRTLVALLALVTACAVSRPPICHLATGWAWFMARRDLHPLMRKMAPHVAAEWWQRIENQPLWPGRSDPYETGVDVDEHGMVELTIRVDGPDAARRLAAALEQPGSASIPTDVTPAEPVGLPVSPGVMQEASATRPARRAPELLPDRAPSPARSRDREHTP
jgi:hypothetical protein